MMLFLLIGISLFASTFKQANTYYDKGEYQKAASIYEELIQNGDRTVGVYYNLGNCYWRLNKIGFARYYWEKAEKISPQDDTEYNISLVRKMTGEKKEENFLTILSSKISFNTLTLVFLIFEYLFLFSLFIYYFIKQEKYLWLGVFFGFIFILTALFFYFYYEREILTREAVVIKEVKFFSSPGLLGKEQGVLPEGRKVILFDITDSWAEVGIKEKSLKAWVNKQAIKEI